MKKLILIMALALSACAFDKNDTTGSDQAQLRQNQLIQETYGDLVGTYKGTLKTSAGSEDVVLIIDIGSEPFTNPNGTPGAKMVPIAVFKRSAAVVANYLLTPRGYIKEKGDLFLINNKILNGQNGNNQQNPQNPPNPQNPNPQQPNIDDITSIEAKVIQGNITGRALTLAGTLGTINLKFFSKETTVPGNGFENEFRQRVIRQYKAIAGEYVGGIKSPDEDIPISITLNVIEGAADPYIVGYYRRLDLLGMGFDLGLTVNYRPDTNPPQITMNGNGGGRYIITIDGTVQNGEIQASFNSLAQGYLGPVIAKKRK